MKEIIIEAILQEERCFLPVIFSEKIISPSTSETPVAINHCLNCLNQWLREKLTSVAILAILSNMKGMLKMCLASLFNNSNETMVHRWSLEKVNSGCLNDFKRKYKRFYRLLHTDNQNAPYITFTPRIAELDTPLGQQIIKEWLECNYNLIYERYILFRSVIRDIHFHQLQEYFKNLPKKFDVNIKHIICSFLEIDKFLKRNMIVLDALIVQK